MISETGVPASRCASFPFPLNTVLNSSSSMTLPPLLQALPWDGEGKEHRCEGGYSGKSMHKDKSHPLAMQMSSQKETALVCSTP